MAGCPHQSGSVCNLLTPCTANRFMLWQISSRKWLCRNNLIAPISAAKQPLKWLISANRSEQLLLSICCHMCLRSCSHNMEVGVLITMLNWHAATLWSSSRYYSGSKAGCTTSCQGLTKWPPSHPIEAFYKKFTIYGGFKVNCGHK